MAKDDGSSSFKQYVMWSCYSIAQVMGSKIGVEAATLFLIVLIAKVRVGTFATMNSKSLAWQPMSTNGIADNEVSNQLSTFVSDKVLFLQDVGW